MGAQISHGEKDLYNQIKLKLATQGKSFDKKELKSITKWVFKNFPGATVPEIIKIEFWKSVGVKLYDLTRKRDPDLLKLLPIFRLILETLEMEGDCQELSAISNPVKPGTASPSSNPGSGMREGACNSNKQKSDRPAFPHPPPSHPSDIPGGRHRAADAKVVPRSEVNTAPATLCPPPVPPYEIQDGKGQVTLGLHNSLHPVPRCSPRPSFSTFFPTTRSAVAGMGSTAHHQLEVSAAMDDSAVNHPRVTAPGPTHSTSGHTPLRQTGTPPTWVPEGPAPNMAAPRQSTLEPTLKHHHADHPVKHHSNKKILMTSSLSSQEDLRQIKSGDDHCEKIHRAAVKGGDWDLVSKFSVTPVQYGGRGVNPRWEAVACGEVKELCKASQEHGRESSYFSSLLLATFSAHVLTPCDIKYIMTMLLSSAEYALWEMRWKRLLNQLLKDYAGDQTQAALTVDHLAGQGAHADQNNQAENLSQAVLNDIKDAAGKALLQVPNGNKPSLDFADTTEDPTEPCMKFLGRLKLALDQQVVLGRAQEELGLAFGNANTECKQILCSLPSEPEPTITQMIAACDRLATPEHSVQLEAQTLAQALAAIQADSKKQQNQGSSKECYKYGKEGHFVRDCSQHKPRPPFKFRGCGKQFYCNNRFYPKQGSCNHQQGSCRQRSTGQQHVRTRGLLSPLLETTASQEVRSCSISSPISQPSCLQVPDWSWPQQNQ
ncbi:uncharacterized protein LOC135290292 [Passer domesticus]|uniref:uncharacterized protein LOC135290292 n=1 Tax=Passer domesticus TaxID=48849 RepID=UPI0030FE7A4A